MLPLTLAIFVAYSAKHMALQMLINDNISKKHAL